VKSFQLLRSDGEFLIAKGDCAADEAGRSMDSFIKLFSPQAHTCAADGVFWAKRFGIGIVELFGDDG
jgi:hypothetical protein